MQPVEISLPAIVVFDIDGVVRDVSGSYRRALADTVEHYTQGAYRPTQADIDTLKAEGQWNNDWEASQEFIKRYYKTQPQPQPQVNYPDLVAWFQSRYRGTDPEHWNGYICQEPLLMQKSYLDDLTAASIRWGFFSGATRGSANYVLEKRLGLTSPVLVAMEDAPGKPDPTGLMAAVQQLDPDNTLAPVIYVGDTVADMKTVHYAQETYPDRSWVAIGVLPPHVHQMPDSVAPYRDNLRNAGAISVLDSVTNLTAPYIHQLLLTTDTD